MKTYLLIAIGLSFLWKAVSSQSLRQPLSIPYVGLGAYSQRHTDVFSFMNNQAALAKLRKSSAGVYGERRFLLEETSLYALALAFPTKMGNIGFNLEWAGFQNFNEHQAGFAYARSLDPRMHIGIQFNYYGYRVPSHQSASTINFEIGGIVDLANQLSLGFHVYNPASAKLSNGAERLPAAYKTGLGYDVSESFFLSAELVKAEDQPLSVKAGIQWAFRNWFLIRMGITTSTSAAYVGAGISWNKLRLDISSSYHPQLGISPGLLLAMELGGKSPSAKEDP